MLNTALVEESAVEQIPDNVAAVSGCPGIAGVVTQLWPVAARVHVADNRRLPKVTLGKGDLCRVCGCATEYGID